MTTGTPPNVRAGCPDRAQLLAFVSGRMTARDMESAADHLAACPHCAATVESLHDADSVVSRLRNCLPAPAPPVDPECERLAAVARLIPLEPTGVVTDMAETKTLAPGGKPEAPAPPRRFGAYDLLDKLGYGGMGVVWKARQVRLNRLVALKMIRFGPASGAGEQERFRREGEAVARVRHPNIVEVYDAGEYEGQPYFAMELLEGGTLARRLRDRPYEPRAAAELVRTLARAVQAAHEAGVVHRDLKPSNVLFGADGAPRVADFGLAKMLDAEAGQTRAGDVLGTPSYMAPEQARGDATAVGPPTDVHALGAILYELLSGKPPFRGADHRATLALVRSREPTPLSRPAAERCGGLAAVCARCLEKRPRDRYPSAAALADDLERWLNGRPTEARSGRRLLRRRAFLGAAIGVVGLGGAAALAGWRLWDPDAAAEGLERRLAGGETAALLGPAGSPAWSRWEVGGQKVVVDRAASDGAFTIHAYELALLGLLRDPRTDRYRIRAEVRQQEDRADGVTQVGIYFGGREYTTPAGPVHVFVQLTFNDIHSQRDFAVNFNQTHPPPAPPLPVPASNGLITEARVYGTAASVSADLDSADVVEATGWNDRRWRSLAVEVAPEEIRAFWGESEAPACVVNARRVEDALRAGPLLDRFPSLKGASLAFFPRGSLGLCVSQGAASFQSVRVEPLRSAD